MQNYSSAGHAVNNNVIKNNRWTGNGYGFTSPMGSGHTIVNNMMWNDGVSWSKGDAGILVKASKHPRV